MRSGSLRHLSSIEGYSETVNGFGETEKAWIEFSKSWADIQPIRGDEKYVSAEKHATATHRITIRYIDGVNPKMRLVSRGRVFEILSVLNIGERDKMMQIIATEAADD